MLRDSEGNIFYHKNYINWDQFNQLYDPEWQTKGTQSANTIRQKLMPASKKAIEQKQAARAKVAQMKKTLRRKNSSLLDQHKYDYYNTDKSQNTQFNDEADLDKMEDLNISSKVMEYGGSNQPEAGY